MKLYFVELFTNTETPQIIITRKAGLVSFNTKILGTIEIQEPKKTVTKEAELIEGYYPGVVCFNMPDRYAENIKCTYEVKE